jgi:8-oxo-dGTP diphosphatase
MTALDRPDAAPSLSTLGVRDLLGRFPVLVPPVTTAAAAVTIVLREGGSGPELLLIERATNPSDPASGQVALPGGHVAERDGSLLATAIRELEEEVGLSRTDFADPLRFVRAENARAFAIRVGIFAGELSHDANAPSVRSADEVAHVFWLPGSELGTTRRVTQRTSRGPLEVNATVFEGHVLWGFTRRALRDFFGLPVEDEPIGHLFAPKPSATEPATNPSEEPSQSGHDSR